MIHSDVIGVPTLGIGLDLTIGSFSRLLLWNVIRVLALGIGLNLTIRSFGRLLLRNVVGVLALDNSTDNLRKMLGDGDATSLGDRRT